VDYYVAPVGANGGFRPGLSVDGVHPDKKGYEIMALIVEKILSVVLNDR
jgi:lysophospholipase L1-like esterase